MAPVAGAPAVAREPADGGAGDGGAVEREPAGGVVAEATGPDGRPEGVDGPLRVGGFLVVDILLVSVGGRTAHVAHVFWGSRRVVVPGGADGWSFRESSDISPFLVSGVTVRTW